MIIEFTNHKPLRMALAVAGPDGHVILSSSPMGELLITGSKKRRVGFVSFAGGRIRYPLGRAAIVPARALAFSQGDIVDFRVAGEGEQTACVLAGRAGSTTYDADVLVVPDTDDRVRDALSWLHTHTVAASTVFGEGYDPLDVADALRIAGVDARHRPGEAALWFPNSSDRYVPARAWSIWDESESYSAKLVAASDTTATNVEDDVRELASVSLNERNVRFVQ